MGQAVALLILAITLSAGGRAAAQDATASSAARALFNEGVTLAEQEQWADAAERFERAIALRDSAVIAYNLGLALEHLGRPVEAAERFRRVARDAAADGAMRASATTALAEVEPRIAWVTITVEGDRLDRALRVDGHAIPDALVGAPTPVDPGTHAITLTEPDGTDVSTRSITMTEGQRESIALASPPRPEVVAEPEPVPAPTHEPVVDLSPPPASSDDTWLWVGIGSGAAVVVAGIVVTIVLVSTPSQASPWAGNAGVIEVGR